MNVIDSLPGIDLSQIMELFRSSEETEQKKEAPKEKPEEANEEARTASQMLKREFDIHGGAAAYTLSMFKAHGL